MSLEKAQSLIVTLGWDLDAFWKEIETADEDTLRYALAILESPAPPGEEECPLERRAQSGASQIRKQLEVRFP